MRYSDIERTTTVVIVLNVVAVVWINTYISVYSSSSVTVTKRSIPA